VEQPVETNQTITQTANQTAAPTVWQYKPWWCQPWSILLTGAVLISGSWLLGHRVWLTLLVALPVVTWMVYFLLVYPRLMQPYLQQSQQGKTGVE
jgi:hypothetical protein